MFGNDNNKTAYKKKNYFKVTDQEQVFGFFGPLFGVRNNAYFHKVHFGYKNSQGKFRPFLSTYRLNKETKAVESPDAALDQLNHFTELLETAKKAGDQPAIERLSKLVGQKGLYNLDKNWHFNVHTLDGQIGTLKMRHRCALILDDKLKQWEKVCVNVFDAQQGRYLKIRRIGIGPDTSYDIQLYEQEEDIGGGRKARVDVVRTISQSLAAKAGGFPNGFDVDGKELYAEGEAADLTKLFQKISPEEIALIVRNTDIRTGNSSACDAIFDARWKEERNSKKGTQPAAKAVLPAAVLASDDDDEPNDDTMSLGNLTAQAPVSVPAAKTQVAKEAKATVDAAPQQAAAALTNAPAFEEMNDDDFFKQVGLKKHG